MTEQEELKYSAIQYALNGPETGTTLRVMRKYLGHTQESLAKLMKTQSVVISKYENGKRKFKTVFWLLVAQMVREEAKVDGRVYDWLVHLAKLRKSRKQNFDEV